MSTTSSQTPYAASGRRVWAEGGGAFAGIMLATLGVFQIFEAIAALANDDIYVKSVNYVFQFDLTTWGWIHLILGIVAVATGLGLMAGQTWSQILGLVIAFLTALSAFSFLPSLLNLST